MAREESPKRRGSQLPPYVTAVTDIRAADRVAYPYAMDPSEWRSGSSSVGRGWSSLELTQMKSAAAKQSQQSDDDQIDCDDVVVQARHHQDQDACNQ